MRISGSSDLRRDPRYQYPSAKAAKLKAASQGQGGGQTASSQGNQMLDATVRDISSTGVSLNTAANVNTSQFVELQMEGMPVMAGKVVRAYGGVVAIQFAEDEAAKKRLQHEVKQLNRVA